MKALVAALSLAVSFAAHAEISQPEASEPMKVTITAPESADVREGLVELIGADAPALEVAGLECNEGFDWTRGKINCIAMANGMLKQTMSDSSAKLNGVLTPAKSMAFKNPANRLVPGIDIIKAKTVRCEGDVCEITFGF